MANLSARIQVEQVMMQNESIKLTMLKNLQDVAQRKLEMKIRNSAGMMLHAPSLYTRMIPFNKLFADKE